MNYFITGATGFVGGRVARKLREQGHGVVALVRNPAKAKDLAGRVVTTELPAFPFREVLEAWHPELTPPVAPLTDAPS